MRLAADGDQLWMAVHPVVQEPFQLCFLFAHLGAGLNQKIAGLGFGSIGKGPLLKLFTTVIQDVRNLSVN